jgi:predicted N-acetyltransferase YhbS
MRSKAYWGYSPEFMESCRSELTVDPKQILSDEFDYMVAVDAETVVGFYAIEKVSSTDFELEALFVEPDRIGNGIGRDLVQHAVKNVARKGGETLLIQGDPNATEFYSAAGARHIGSRESESIPGRFLPLFQIPVYP